MARRRYFFSSFADICLVGTWQIQELSHRIADAVGEEAAWIRPYAQHLKKRFPAAPPRIILVDFLCADSRLAQIRQQFQPVIRHYSLETPPLNPPHPAVPQLFLPGDLARWLGIGISDLDWFADRSNRAAKSTVSKVHHYHISTLTKRGGGTRLLEIPKPTLKLFQRRIHENMLPHLPLHSAAFGFVTDRPALHHARLHVGQAVVLRFDLSDCFLHVHGGHVYRAFRSLGFGDGISRELLGLCTHRIPIGDLKSLDLSERQRRLVQQNHLPQGAPSSPLLSHFALAGIDKRLSSYVHKLEARYSRYVDDLVISGGVHLQRQFRQIEGRVGAIALEEGFILNYRKSRCMTASKQQRVTGITVNQHLNIPRRDFDSLKAELHQCVQKGWRSQSHTFASDYRAHLRGRLEWCRQLNPVRAEKLLRLFECINWD